jgi:hypothetical protein
LGDEAPSAKTKKAIAITVVILSALFLIASPIKTARRSKTIQALIIA